MSSSMVPMSRPGLGGMGISGGYSGAIAMANNGLNPHQNQVKNDDKRMIHWSKILILF